MKKHQPKHMKPQPTLRSRVGASVATVAVVAGLGLAPVTAPVVALADEASTSTSSSTPLAPQADGSIVVEDGQTGTYDDDVTVSKDDSDVVTDPGGYTYLNAEGVEARFGSTGEIEGDVDVSAETENANPDWAKATGVSAAGADVTIRGNVTSTLSVPDDVNGWSYGVNAWGEYDYYKGSIKNSNVTVTKDVTAVSNGDASSWGVSSYHSTVNVGGNVTSTDVGVWADEESTVGVGGNVTSSDLGVWAEDESTVRVGGNVEAEDFGVWDTNASTVVVRGNVTSERTGAVVATYDEQEGNTYLVVEGTLYGEDNALWIYVGDATDEASPVVVVKSLKTGEDGTLLSGSAADEDDDESRDLTAEEVAAFVYYIVDYDGFVVDGTTTVDVDGTTYVVAREGDKLTLTLKSGYKVGATTFAGDGSSYIVTDNGDGTYTIAVRSGGGLTFIAQKLAAAGGIASGSASGTARTASVTSDVIAPRETLPATGDATGASALGIAVLAGVAAVGAGAHFRRREE